MQHGNGAAQPRMTQTMDVSSWNSLPCKALFLKRTIRGALHGHKGGMCCLQHWCNETKSLSNIAHNRSNL